MYKIYINYFRTPTREYHKILLIMRLTTVILIASLMQLSAATFGQHISLSMQNVPLKSVLREMTKQSGFGFYYDGKVIADNQKVNIKLTNVEFDDALKTVFSDLKLSYSIDGKIVSIKKAADPSFFDRLVKLIQAVDLYGRVTDETGAPLAGASVRIKDKNQVVKTNYKGEFTFINIDENAILIVSYVGYQEQEIKVSANVKDLVVHLVPSTSKLDEVQVAINTGYQKINPEQSTGSISVVAAKEYNSRINTTDFLTGLQNKIPGLLINNDIKFENNSLFQIRGISTISGNRQPLIVIDGYPTELTLESINPNDIETVTVLKDAAAATIYGVRASNGVIVIERKKAKVGPAKVVFRSTFSATPKEDYSRYRWDKNASSTVVDYVKNKNLNIYKQYWSTVNSLSGYYLSGDPVLLIMGHWRSDTSPISLEERDRQLAELASYNNTEDYGRLFLRTATAKTNNLDISGGSQNLLYFLTANYTDNHSQKIKDDNGNVLLSGRVTMKLSNKLTLDLTNNFQSIKSSSTPIPSIYDIYPYERFQDANGAPLPIYTKSRVTPNYNKLITAIGLQDNLYYPLMDINQVSDKYRTINNRITANLNYNIGNGFSTSLGGVYESSVIRYRHLASESSTEVRQYVNHYTTGTNGTYRYYIPKGAFLKEQTSSKEGYTVRAQLNYNKELNVDHSLNVIAGAEVRDVLDKSNTASYFGYNDNTLATRPVDFDYVNSGSFPVAWGITNPLINYGDLFNQRYVDNRYVSAYSNLVYSYKGKYSLSGSIRIDQSNLFGTNPKYRYKALWSAGTAWNIDKEDFMENINWIDALKLRASYGFNGNVAKNVLPQVIASDGINYTDAASPSPMLSLLSYANSGLRWEQTSNLNFGLDYDIFKGIRGSVDYYVKTSKDLLANNQMDASKGGSYAIINEASIRNNGLEIGLNADWISRKRFNFNTGFFFSHNTSKVLKVYNARLTPESQSFNYVEGVASKYFTGYPVGTLFSYRYANLDNMGDPLIYAQDGTKKTLYKDQGFKDVDYSGTTIPAYNIGFSNRVDIGNFYAYAMVNYYGGFKVRVPVPSLLTNPGSIRPLEGANNYWRQPGDEANPNLLPSVTSSLSSGNYSLLATTNKYTVNGAYLTLGDVTLAYSFRDILKKRGISDIELKLQASNIYTVAFNDYKYSLATGSYEKSYLTPTYTVALNINF